MKHGQHLILALACFLLFQIHDILSIDRRFRRFELIMSGFKDDRLEGRGRERRCNVTINGIKTISRLLSINPDKEIEDEEFLLYYVVNQYESSYNSDNYFLPEKDLGDAAFEMPLTFRFLCEYKDTGSVYRNFLTGALTDDYRIAPNADRVYRSVVIADGFRVDIFVGYQCQGYNGLGCRFLCDVGTDVPYECLYDTNEKLCKDRNRFNPPDCTSTQPPPCTVNPCKNGTCVRVSEDKTYCACFPGYSGTTCQLEVCDTPCDPDFGECVGANKCKCQDGWGGALCNEVRCNSSTCKNGGTCSSITLEVICECDPSRFGGKLCEVECRHPCIFGSCVEKVRGVGECQCFDQFTGSSCNETLPEPEPLFEDGYLSVKQQRIIYVGITIGFVFLAIIVFGIGSYQRTNKKRNLRVIKGTETAMRTLQTNQQLTQTLVASQFNQFGGNTRA